MLDLSGYCMSVTFVHCQKMDLSICDNKVDFPKYSHRLLRIDHFQVSMIFLKMSIYFFLLVKTSYVRIYGLGGGHTHT